MTEEPHAAREPRCGHPCYIRYNLKFTSNIFPEIKNHIIDYDEEGRIFKEKIFFYAVVRSIPIKISLRKIRFNLFSFKMKV